MDKNRPFKKEKFIWKRLKVLMLILVLGVSLLSSVMRMSTKAITLEEVRKQRQELQQKKAESDKQINSLSKDKKNLQAALNSLNSQLYEVSAEISDLEEQIAIKEDQIEASRQIIELTEQIIQNQYDSMKLRIQFLYENGGMQETMFSLLEANSFAEFLTKSQYVLDIAETDRKLLMDYENTLAELEEEKRVLEQEEADLEQTREELKAKEEKLLASISGTKTNLANTTNALNANQEVSKTLAQQIAAMEEYERKLEAEKAAAAQKMSESRIAQIARQEAELAAGNRIPPVAEGEAELLAALIYCEAGGEGYTAQVAVATVVANRVCSAYYPNSITAVIYQNKQFSPAMSGKLALVLENGMTTQSCRNAANEVLAGGVSGNWLFFCVNKGGINGTVINHQVFY